MLTTICQRSSVAERGPHDVNLSQGSLMAKHSFHKRGSVGSTPTPGTSKFTTYRKFLKLQASKSFRYKA